MCREHAPEAVATLVAALKDPKHKLAAASELLDRGFGRPRQVIENPDGASPSALHLLAAQLVSAEILAAFEQRNTIGNHAEATKGDAVDFLTASIPTE
jgi:hypothetical protein